MYTTDNPPHSTKRRQGKVLMLLEHIHTQNTQFCMREAFSPPNTAPLCCIPVLSSNPILLFPWGVPLLAL